MTSDLPRVACSCVLIAGLAGRGVLCGSGAAGVKLRCGSGLGVGVEEGALVGFHMSVRILSEVNSAWRGTGFAKPKLHSSSSEPDGLVRLIRVTVPCTPIRARECDVIIATIQRVLVSGKTPTRIFPRDFHLRLIVRMVTDHEKLRQRLEIVGDGGPT